MGSEVNFSELLQLMHVGLIGANYEINKVLMEFHEIHNKPTHGFLFSEFLVHQPLHKPLYKERPLDYEKIWTFYPFPARLARRATYFTEEEIAELEILINMADTAFSRCIYDAWQEKGHLKLQQEIPGTQCTMMFEKLEVPKFGESFFVRLQGYTFDVMKKIIEKEVKFPLSSKSLVTLHGLRWEHYPYCRRDKSEEITSFLIPIASSQIFYGDLLVSLPHFELRKGKKEDIDRLVKQLASELLLRVKKHYVPALALIHEHFFEKLIADDVKDVKEETNVEDALMDVLTKSYPLEFDTKLHYKSPICRRAGENQSKEPCWTCPYFGWEESSDNVVEKYLHKLWNDRKTIREKEYIKESLFFKERLYTDPKMLEVLEGFLKPSKAKLRKEGDYLPSVLVEAPPGAGKEDMARLFKLFSDHYNRGKTYKLNMASLKPDAIAPVAMVGGEVTWEGSSYKEGKHQQKGPSQDVMLIGILQQIRDITHIEFKEFLTKVSSEDVAEESKRYKEGLEVIIASKLGQLKEKVFGVLEATCKQAIDRVKSVKPLLDNLRELERKLFQEGMGKQQAEIKGLIGLAEKLKHVKSLIGKLGKLKKKRAGMSPIELLKELKLAPGEKLIVKKLFGKFPTVVLDELNSLDIDSQGVLLRFIEKGEITPIGSYEDRMWGDGEAGKDYREFLTDFLVVGLMNEDPGEITREKAIEFLRQKDSYISGLLGDLLYEHILRIRRLRPDLRHRMMRYGEFKMPELARHRGDIPVIFYITVNKFKGDYFPNSEIRVTMDALRYLMRHEFDWPENVRQLQALIMKAVEIVYEDYQDRRYKEEPLPMIDRKNLVIIREKHIRKAMEELGMLIEFE